MSVCPAVQPGPCQAHCPGRPLRPCALHRSISDRWGQGGARGRARSKGPLETDAGCWDGKRDAEMGRQRHRDRGGDPQT